MLSTLWSTSVPAVEITPQHDAASPDPQSWVGVLMLPSFPLILENVVMVIVAKHFTFSFNRPQNISSNMNLFIP